MSVLRSFFFSLRKLVSPGASSEELEAELQFHIDMSVEQKLAAGMSREQAEREARKEFGSDLRVKEDCRMSWGTRLVDETVQDVRRGMRRLWKRPSYSVPVVVILSIALGVCGVLSSIVTQRILRPMAYPDADEIIELGMDHSSPEFRLRMTPTQLLIAEKYLDQEDLFESIGFMNAEGRFIRHDLQTVYFYVTLMTPGMWELMKLLPEYGRPFTENDIESGHELLTVITYDYARKTFGSPEAAIGKALRLNDELYQVVGVMGKGDYFPDNRPIAIPLTGLNALTDNEKYRTRVTVLCRLKENVSLEQLTDRQTVILDAAKEQHAVTKRYIESCDIHLRFHPRVDRYRFSWQKLGFQQMVGIVSVLALLLYLIACSNWLGVFRTHLIRQCRVTGICFGLGAPRVRLLRSICMEVQLLFGLAVVGGVSVAIVIYSLVNYSTLFANEPLLKDVVGFSTIVLLALIGSSFSLPFILAHLRTSKIYQYLHERTSTTSVRSKGLFLLSVLQVFLGVVIVLISAFLSLNIYRILMTDFGFDYKNRIVASLTMPEWKGSYTAERKLDFLAELKQVVEQAPGYESVALATNFPQCFLAFYSFTGGIDVGLLPHAIESPSIRDGHVRFTVNAVDEDFAKTMGLRLRQGRCLEKADTATPEIETVIDVNAAKELFGDENPVGFSWSDEEPRRGEEPIKHFYRIVGVIEPVDYQGNQRKVNYSSFQVFRILNDTSSILEKIPVFGIVGKLTKGHSLEAVKVLQEAVREIDPDVYVAVRFYEDAVRNQYRTMLQMSGVSIVLSILTVIIAAYGFISFLFYKTELMKKEFSIRLALGARTMWMLFRYMVRQSISIGIGTVLGIAVVYVGFAQFGQNLTEVEMGDWGPVAGVLVAMCLFVGLAALIPLFQMRNLEIREILQGD